MTEKKIILSESAALQINAILRERNLKGFLRVRVEGGGCSGFQYTFDFVDHKEKEDILIKRNQASVLIDPISAELMQGAMINYVEEMIGSRFCIENPNAKTSCGCGTSFSL